jgi:hypothetical protein
MDLRHKHWALIVVGVLIAIFALIIGWHALRPQPVEAPADPAATSTPVASTTADIPAKISETATYYTIDLAYPTVTPLVNSNATANAQAVALMRQAMQQQADSFKKDQNFDHLSHDDVQMMGLDQRKMELSSTYAVYTGSRTVSYVFQIYMDTLGAHGNIFYQTFTFDRSTGQRVVLKDLFASPAYLQTLSLRARKDLPGIIANITGETSDDFADSMIEDGTKPTEDTFANFYINGANLVIVFEPYQVGPYALGTVELPIPLNQLDVKSEYK